MRVETGQLVGSCIHQGEIREQGCIGRDGERCGQDMWEASHQELLIGWP